MTLTNQECANVDPQALARLDALEATATRVEAMMSQVKELLGLDETDADGYQEWLLPSIAKVDHAVDYEALADRSRTSAIKVRRQLIAMLGLGDAAFSPDDNERDYSINCVRVEDVEAYRDSHAEGCSSVDEDMAILWILDDLISEDYRMDRLLGVPDGSSRIAIMHNAGRACGSDCCRDIEGELLDQASRRSAIYYAHRISAQASNMWTTTSANLGQVSSCAEFSTDAHRAVTDAQAAIKNLMDTMNAELASGRLHESPTLN